MEERKRSCIPYRRTVLLRGLVSNGERNRAIFGCGLGTALDAARRRMIPLRQLTQQFTPVRFAELSQPWEASDARHPDDSEFGLYRLARPRAGPSGRAHR